MCGIIGILGRGPVAEQLVDSLNPAAKGDTKVDADEALQAVVDEAQKAVA